MSLQLRWLASLSASALHAAEILAREGLPLADPALAAELAPAAAALGREIEAAGLPPARFWRELTALAAGIENNTQLVATALQKTLGPRAAAASAAPRLAGRVCDVEAALLRVRPRLADELALRGRPLREQWEARGPGLWTQLARLLPEDVLPPQADVVLVHPALGGGGAAHLPYNTVRFEAVLANPLAELPETVRLAWLLAQLQQDLPRFSEGVPPDRLPYVAPLALLPPVLQAAAHVELAASGPATTDLALRAWRIAVPPHLDAAGALADWWSVYVDTRPPWRVALQALDRLLGE